jgi:lipid A ethanolaminephosphotransferase
VLVLVLGETARAANFSLLGYARQTNPELARLDVVALSDVHSCGTSTEVSVPCMFSRDGRANYDEARIRQSEGVLQVLARAGYAVQWRDNQSGCKGVCAGTGIDYRKLKADAAPGLCRDGECYDEILVESLRADIAAVQRDTVIVLHMMGNHGPAYHRRYPPAFRRFQPDCQTAQLRDCSRAEVVNAYDNAILYTDHVLADIVRTLDTASTRLDTAMLYVSDHGESLGEGGFYLHGLPYRIAPEVQTRVPMLLWLSPDFAASAAIDRSCLQAQAALPRSHDNLFDSVLGALQVETVDYRAELDLFAACRAGPGKDPAELAASVSGASL